MRAYIAVTDPAWLRRLAVDRLREANFWQPRPSGLRQESGTPWIFKVRGSDLVGGYGFFSYYSVMPSGVAWETFGLGNGVESYLDMRQRLAMLRHRDTERDDIGCIVLSELHVLQENEYVAAPADWKTNTVRGQYYNLHEGEGARIWTALTSLAPQAIEISPLDVVPGGYGKATLHAPRIGQGAFRLMVMDAYRRECAITRDKTLPALDAAHIRPFNERQSHEIRNGILMRSDIHRLFDQGYVTVTPDCKFRVSPEIRNRFNNGLIYYQLHGKPIALPERADHRPDADALAWHFSRIYRGD